MDKNTLYYKNISERSLIHFIKGLLPRIIIKNREELH